VNYNITHFSPNLENNNDLIDEVNSGKYIVASLRHYIKNGEYTMSAELIRDGIGEDADLDRLFNKSSRSKQSNPSPITGGFSTL
jgi:hypothetical protein